METVPSRSLAVAEGRRVAVGGGCDGCSGSSAPTGRSSWSLKWLLEFLLSSKSPYIYGQCKFPPERAPGCQGYQGQERRQGRELARKLLAGWLSSLLWNITVGVASIVLKCPGSQGAPKDSVLNARIGCAWLPIHRWPPSQPSQNLHNQLLHPAEEEGCQ